MTLAQSVEQVFQEKFKEQALLVRSPGRVNLIGEHTDYNKGFVLPAAIDKSITLAISPRNDRHCSMFAMDMNEAHEFSIDDLHSTPKGWPNYLMGVVDQFVKAQYPIQGFHCVFGGDIPIGAGMSSSAALEAGLAFALNTLFHLHIDRLTLVKMAQKAENVFVGVQCGIMDQYINIFGKQDNVLRIDCRTLEYQYYPFAFHNISVVLFDTRVSHSLASSEYNRRREECSEGVAVIKKMYPEVNSLRDVTCDMLHQCRDRMDPTVYRRCKYVVEENERVLHACGDLEKGDLKSFGAAMKKTHAGLSGDYEVSCKELDFLVDLMSSDPQVYGSRMMGGGFGGCTINLIEKNHVEEVSSFAAVRYKQKFNIDLKTYITSIGPGTRIIAGSGHEKD
ncbi:MAG: galactokinase [Ignavibacteriae bacterium]|nr:MAG: galactokinase [Ignavibacteriota bacterium]